MTVNDKRLAEIISNNTPVMIAGNYYTVVPNKAGSCDGCVFQSTQCPQKAVTICTSNGGNILKAYKEHK